MKCFLTPVVLFLCRTVILEFFKYWQLTENIHFGISDILVWALQYHNIDFFIKVYTTI